MGPPSIAIASSAEVRVTPDRATVRISVQTKESTASAAASANAKKQSAVLDALRKAGISNDRISTTDYNVNPDYRYEPNVDPILTGYSVTNTVIVDIRDISQVGKVLDAALGSGANLVSSLEFYASNTDAARKQAMTEAITKARSEAEVAARAAGGSLGGLLELNVDNISSNPPPRPMYKMAMDAAGSTPISPGQQTLNVNVSTRWSFIQPR